MKFYLAVHQQNGEVTEVREISQFPGLEQPEASRRPLLPDHCLVRGIVCSTEKVAFSLAHPDSKNVTQIADLIVFASFSKGLWVIPDINAVAMDIRWPSGTPSLIKTIETVLGYVSNKEGCNFLSGLIGQVNPLFTASTKKGQTELLIRPDRDQGVFFSKRKRGITRYSLVGLSEPSLLLT